MAGLPAKYAKMGFSKGWKAFRAVHKKTKAAHAAATKKAEPVVKKRSGGMKISKERLEGMKASVSKALAKVRAAKATDGGEMALAVAEGIGAGVASSYAIGMIPVPAALPKPAMAKSALQVAAGFGLALAVKNKHAKYAGYGMAIMGGIGLARELFPIPTFAGEVDESMYGADWTPEGLNEPLGFEEAMSTGMGEPLGAEPAASGTYSPFG